MSIGPVEFFWVGLNGVVLILTLMALWAAIRTRRRVLILKDRAALIVATGTVRRETFRALAQVGLISIAVPELFRDRDITLTAPVLALMTVPIFIFMNTYSDRHDRVLLDQMTDEEISSARDHDFAEIKTLIRENTVLTQAAVTQAAAAYSEANHVNEKIAAQTQAVVDHRLMQDTNDKVTDIHNQVVDD